MRLLPYLPEIAATTLLLTAQNGSAPPPVAMTISIPGFPDGGRIPVKFSQAAPGGRARRRHIAGHQLGECAKTKGEPKGSQLADGSYQIRQLGVSLE